jgi:hypothetical protein
MRKRPLSFRVCKDGIAIRARLLNMDTARHESAGSLCISQSTDLNPKRDHSTGWCQLKCHSQVSEDIIWVIH